jgi:hypothetical protein
VVECQIGDHARMMLFEFDQVLELVVQQLDLAQIVAIAQELAIFIALKRRDNRVFHFVFGFNLVISRVPFDNVRLKKI